MSDERAVDWSGIEVLSNDECRQRLASSSVGRVAFMDAGSPVVLPVNYTMDGPGVVFRSAPGSKLAAATLRHPVAFEIDWWDEDDRLGWSVLAKGIADHVLDDEEIERLEQLPVRPWTRPDLRDQWVRIMVEELTGREVIATSARTSD